MRVLTGIQSSGTPHWGNYFGAIAPAVERQNSNDECFYFIADLHSLTTQRDPQKFREFQINAVIDWLALGLNPDKSTFFIQSQVPAHTELMWILTNLTPMGLLQRAHSFKDKEAKGIETNVGLFTYPVLMAADILLYDTEVVPVGQDQKQHVEIARDIAQKFNNHYGETFTLPTPQISKTVGTLPGIDGQKMSKSYGNAINIFADEKSLKKNIMSIKTESIPLGHPINSETCPIFAFHKLFNNPKLEEIKTQYEKGTIGFGDSKQNLFELVWEFFAPARKIRENLVNNLDEVKKIMDEGAKKANKIAEKKIQTIRKKVGIL